MKHILVTGGAGYLGCRLVAYLLGQGHRITVLDRLDYGGEGLLGHLDNPRFGLLRHESFCVPPWKADCIVHLAAVVGEAACQANPDDARQTNVELTRYLAGLGIPMILASTCSNYGRTDELADEKTPLKPLGLYAETKIEAEKIVLNAGGTVLRFATLYGPSPRMRFDLMINELALCNVENEPFMIFNPDAWRPFLHILDACRAIGIAIEHGNTGVVDGQVFNVVGENLQKSDLWDLVPLSAPPAEIRKTDGDDPRDYRVSDVKARDAFHWHRRESVADNMPTLRQAVTLLPETKRRIYRNVA